MQQTLLSEEQQRYVRVIPHVSRAAQATWYRVQMYFGHAGTWRDFGPLMPTRKLAEMEYLKWAQEAL